MVGRRNREHLEDVLLLIIIFSVIAYAVWKIVAG